MGVYRSIEVFGDDLPFDRLPADIRRALTEEEAAAYREGPAYFLGRSSGCRYRPVRSFFRLLGRARAMRLHLYAGRRPRFRIYFGFSLLAIGRYVQVRLGPGVELPGTPPPGLGPLYQDVGGTIDGREGPPWSCGGWEPPEDVRSVAAHQWQPTDSGGYDVDQSYPVYSFGNGDFAGYAGRRRGFLFDHERSRMEPWDLLDFAEEYFGDYPQAFAE
jgi:hypothetical protein